MQEYLEKKLMDQEGYRSHPYQDTKGILTIGIGRNLKNNGISFDEAVYLMRNDIKIAEYNLKKHITFYNNLDDSMKYILINLCFNIGINKLLEFRKMLAYMAVNNREKAADELLDSAWAEQVGENRSNQIATVLRTGEMK